MGLGLGSGPRCVPGWRNAPIMSYPPPPFTPNPHQGTGDEICPEIFAKQLVAGVRVRVTVGVGVRVRVRVRVSVRVSVKVRV